MELVETTQEPTQPVTFDSNQANKIVEKRKGHMEYVADDSSGLVVRSGPRQSAHVLGGCDYHALVFGNRRGNWVKLFREPKFADRHLLKEAEVDYSKVAGDSCKG